MPSQGFKHQCQHQLQHRQSSVLQRGKGERRQLTAAVAGWGEAAKGEFLKHQILTHSTEVDAKLFHNIWGEKSSPPCWILPYIKPWSKIFFC